MLAVTTMVCSIVLFNIPNINWEWDKTNQVIRYDLKYSEKMFLKRKGDHSVEIYKGIDSFVTVDLFDMDGPSLQNFLDYYFINTGDIYYINQKRCSGISLFAMPNRFSENHNYINISTIACY